MLWIITKDLINTEPDDTNRVGYLNAGSRKRREAWDAAPAEARPAIKQAWIDACNFEFRLYDDDGELYYEGVCLNLDDQDGDSAFEPLDWAMSDVGCTTMKYRKKGAAIWQTL